jgi:hypothetical protein
VTPSFDFRAASLGSSSFLLRLAQRAGRPHHIATACRRCGVVAPHEKPCRQRCGFSVSSPVSSLFVSRFSQVPPCSSLCRFDLAPVFEPRSGTAVGETPRLGRRLVPLFAPLATGGLACLISFVEAVPLLFSAFLPVSASLVFACYDFGLMLGYRHNSLRNFNWLPFTPPLVASSVLQRPLPTRCSTRP